MSVAEHHQAGPSCAINPARTQKTTLPTWDIPPLSSGESLPKQAQTSIVKRFDRVEMPVSSRRGTDNTTIEHGMRINASEYA